MTLSVSFVKPNIHCTILNQPTIFNPLPLTTQVTSHQSQLVKLQVTASKIMNNNKLTIRDIKSTTVCCKPVERCILYMPGTARKQIKSTSSEKINFRSHNRNLKYSTYTVKIKLLRSMFTDSL